MELIMTTNLLLAAIIRQALRDLSNSPWKSNGKPRANWPEILSESIDAYRFFHDGRDYYGITPEMKIYIYNKARKEGEIVLPDRFFEEYAKTGPPATLADAEDVEEKDVYTRAEVDDIVNRKIAEALESMKAPATAPETTTKDVETKED